MIASLEQLSTEAWTSWRDFIELHDLAAELGPRVMRPSVLAVKVADRADLATAFGQYYEQGDQGHFGPNGERAIAVIRKASPYALGSLRNVELIEAKPGRMRQAGLGFHGFTPYLDFLGFTVFNAMRLFSLRDMIAERGIDCTLEAPGRLSIKPGGIEFKLTDHDVWDICLNEVRAARV